MSGDNSGEESGSDVGSAAAAAEVRLTDTQLQILEALCGPALGGNRYATPATNQEIAGRVYLSVDAVKAHLRTLYRKFGIEELPHNQKRARLVELVLEGGYLAGEADIGEGPPPLGLDVGSVTPGRRRRRLGAIAIAVAAGAALLLAILVLSGAFSGGSVAESTAVAPYKISVRGYCRLALSGEGRGVGSTAQERARSYLEVIETVRGRLASLPPPAGSNLALERFRVGLDHAADFTSIVAQDPPAAGTQRQENVVAELTFAAGQVQAGALGYGLGPNCVAIGTLAARSARNAAHVP
jgi:DNA-binding MarR family transcriptional regulator